MDNKSLKKSTMEQLKKLVYFMEERPEFAKGTPVFGANKFSSEEEWKNLSQKLNSLAPPMRTIAEWKKTWADLKCRTKKKIADNQKSLRETGGGLYRFTNLTELEQVIDRTLCLSSAAAPSGKVFGYEGGNIERHSIEDCFQSLVETPPRSSKAVAVITPSRHEKESQPQPSKEQQQLKTKITETNPQPIDRQLTPSSDVQQLPSKRYYPFQGDSDDEQPCSSAKKRKTTADQQLALIRRQLRVAEQNAATAKEQADAAKRLADAAEEQAISAKRIADAAEAQAASMKAIEQFTIRIEKVFEKFLNKPL